MAESNKKTTEASAPRKRSVSYFIYGISVVIFLLVGLVAGTRIDQFGSIPNNSLKPLQETYKALHQNYDGKLDDKKLIEGASRGMVEAAGDPYTAYFNKNEAKEFASDLDGTFSGIGAELGKKDNKLVVISALDFSPAQKAGLAPNDIIAKVNGEDSSDWSIDKAVSKIRGEKDTTVKLTIVRGDQVVEPTITRDNITYPSVKTEESSGGVGIIRISRFGKDTASLVRKAAEKFKGKKGIVVDLRGNGGGYLDAAQEVASLWLDKDQTIVTERVGGEIKQTHGATGDNVLKGVPTVVLIDEGSASASEILAGALQDHRVATIVGQKSFGKGSVQDVVELSGGAELKVTIAKWYTPNGKNIGKQGITPDKIIAAGLNNNQDNDSQLQKALDIIK